MYEKNTSCYVYNEYVFFLLFLLKIPEKIQKEKEKNEQLFIKATPQSLSLDYKKVTITCYGKTNYPNGSLLQTTLSRITPIGNFQIIRKPILIRNGNFKLVIEYILAKLPPGKYKITIFYAPRMQKIKTNLDFYEENLHFSIGTKKQYEKTFHREYQKYKQLYKDIDTLWKLSIRDFNSARKSGRKERWYYRIKKRKKQLNTLREKEKNYSSRYLPSFFPHTYRDIYPLLNIIEDFEENGEKSILQNTDYTQKNRKQMKELYQYSWNRFCYESTELSTDKVPYMILSLESLKKTYKEQSSPPKETFTKDFPQAILYLMQLRKLDTWLKQSRLKKKILLAISPKWLWELKNLQYKIQTINAMHHTLFQMIFGLIAQWEKEMKAVKLLQAHYKVMQVKTFDKLWQNIKTKAFFSLLHQHMQVEIQWIENIVKKLYKGNPIPKNILKKYNTQILEHQQAILKLHPIAERKDKKIIENYSYICSYTIAIFSMYNINIRNTLNQKENLEKLLENISNFKTFFKK